MNKKVLVIDDEPSATAFLRPCFKVLGIEMLFGGNGADGLRRAQEETPDLILLDWMMPEMDGLETLTRLKSQERTRDIPVIMLTAKQEAKDFSLAFEAGADGYITKPYPIDEILLILKRFGLTLRK